MNTGDITRYHKKLKTNVNNLDNTHNYHMVTFYKFTSPTIAQDELQQLRDTIYDHLKNFEIKGTVLIGTEGINGTISAINHDNLCNLEQAFNFIQNQPQIGELFGKYSVADFDPFKKLKIKVRPEIVTLGMGKVDVLEKTGAHISPKDWNTLLEDPEVIVIDTRNDFEYKMGTFKNAVNPDTKTFRELPEFVTKNLNKNKDTKIAMFCTGGVRCEKSTAYLKDLGFENVYQLDGGILNYFQEIDEKDSLWDGRCFIFDDRIAVNQQLEPVGVPEDYINYGRRDLMPKDDEY
jgi:UPF0176 protein